MKLCVNCKHCKKAAIPDRLYCYHPESLKTRAYWDQPPRPIAEAMKKICNGKYWEEKK